MTRRLLIFALLASATVALLLLNVFFGAVDIPAADVADILLGRDVHDDSWRFIILESRLPQAVTALLCGCSLAVCGLMLQAVFRNPLADPSILGISSGAGLGVAFVMLLYGGSVSVGMLSIGGFATVLAAAFLGATAVTLLMFRFMAPTFAPEASTSGFPSTVKVTYWLSCNSVFAIAALVRISSVGFIS